MTVHHIRSAALPLVAVLAVSILTSCAQSTNEELTSATSAPSAVDADLTARSSQVAGTESTERAGLGFGTFGDIRLGMTVAQVITEGFTLDRSIQADGCDGYENSHAPDGTPVGLYFRPADGTLSKIRVDSGTDALPEQQPSVAQVQSAYSDATVTELPARGPQGPRLSVREESAGALIIYTIIGDTATRPTTVGSTAPGCPEFTE